MLRRVTKAAPRMVRTPVGFLAHGTQDAVSKALQRLVKAGGLRRIHRGFKTGQRSIASHAGLARRIRVLAENDYNQ
jgi:hypothetical protein